MNVQSSVIQHSLEGATATGIPSMKPLVRQPATQLGLYESNFLLRLMTLLSVLLSTRPIPEVANNYRVV